MIVISGMTLMKMITTLGEGMTPGMPVEDMEVVGLIITVEVPGMLRTTVMAVIETGKFFPTKKRLCFYIVTLF